MSILRNRANPCDADEYGLTPLMYAVFNGHLECVKWLLANDRGVDNHGVKRSAISMQSSKGYTALHLHCMDSLAWASEILIWLLASGIDIEIKCTEGLNAEDHAHREKNDHTIEVLRKFKALKNYTGKPADEDLNGLRISLDKCKDDLANNYSFDSDASVIVEPWDADFPVPAFIFEPQRVGNLPLGLKVYEHQIKPLMEVGYNQGNNMSVVDSLRCLTFTDSQAEMNRSRREEILKIADPDWNPPEKIHFTSRIKKRNVKKRTAADDEGAEVISAVTT